MSLLLIPFLLLGPFLILVSYFGERTKLRIGFNILGVAVTLFSIFQIGLLFGLSHRFSSANFFLPYSEDHGSYEMNLPSGRYMIEFHRNRENLREPFSVSGALSISATTYSSRWPGAELIEVNIFESEDVQSTEEILVQDVTPPTFFFEHPGGRLKIRSNVSAIDYEVIDFITLRTWK